MTIDEICKQSSENNEIKLQIPETIICTYDSVITYMWSDELGIIRTK